VFTTRSRRRALISDGKPSILFGGDSGPTRDLWKVANNDELLRAIIVEASFPNRLHDLAKASVMCQRYVYKPVVVSPLRLGSAQALRLGSGHASTEFRTGPSTLLRLRTEPAEVTGLSNHGRNVLNTVTLRLAQGERNLSRSVRRSALGSRAMAHHYCASNLQRGVSSVGRARRSQRRGRGFESPTLHHSS
jgi:hypothetical protein